MWSSEALYAPETVVNQLLYSLSLHIFPEIICEAAIAIASVLKVNAAIWCLILSLGIFAPLSICGKLWFGELTVHLKLIVLQFCELIFFRRHLSLPTFQPEPWSFQQWRVPPRRRRIGEYSTSCQFLEPVITYGILKLYNLNTDCDVTFW